LREIKQQAEEATKKLEMKAKQKEDTELAAFNEKERMISQETLAMKKQFEEDLAKHRDEEALARKKKLKIESEVENWIHKYDQDMEEKQVEIDDISVPSFKP
jgi:IQ domain-containing protein D